MKFRAQPEVQGHDRNQHELQTKIKIKHSYRERGKTHRQVYKRERERERERPGWSKDSRWSDKSRYLVDGLDDNVTAQAFGALVSSGYAFKSALEGCHVVVLEVNNSAP